MPNGSLDDLKGSSVPMDSEPSGTAVVIEEEQEQETQPKPEVDTTPKDELFDLPDGRKVDAKGLQAEYQKILPEFTRRSQRLAELEKTKPEPKAETKIEPEPWEKEGWQPKTWQEVFEAGKRATLKEVSPILSEVEQAKQAREATARIQEAAEAEMNAIKESDPRVNEDLVYKTATKFNTSLTAAHQFLKETKEIEKATEQRVLKNLKTRLGDNVGINSPGSEVDDTPTYQEINSQKSIASAARAALRSLRK